jgi:hypothetical protein
MSVTFATGMSGYVCVSGSSQQLHDSMTVDRLMTWSLSTPSHVCVSHIWGVTVTLRRYSDGSLLLRWFSATQMVLCYSDGSLLLVCLSHVCARVSATRVSLSRLSGSVVCVSRVSVFHCYMLIHRCFVQNSLFSYMSMVWYT